MHQGNVKSGWWWAADALFSGRDLSPGNFSHHLYPLGKQILQIFYSSIRLATMMKTSLYAHTKTKLWQHAAVWGPQKIRGRQSNSIKWRGQLQSGKRMSLSVFTEWWRHVTLHCSPNHHIQMAAGPVNAALLTCATHSTLWWSHTP